MDGRKNPFSLSDDDETIDARRAPAGTDVLRHGVPDDDLTARDPIQSQFIAFSGDQQQVNDGFAIALRVMGLDANFSGRDIPPLATNPNRETTK
jgi:hypothetical protein